MYSTKLSVSVHILCLIALRPAAAMTSAHMAGSIGTNPALVRRLMSRLRKAGLIRTCRKVGAVGLAKPADALSLLEIFRAVEPEPQLFALHTGTNARCPVGANIGAVMAEITGRIQTGFEDELRSVYLSDILIRLRAEGAAERTD